MEIESHGEIFGIFTNWANFIFNEKLTFSLVSSIFFSKLSKMITIFLKNTINFMNWLVDIVTSKEHEFSSRFAGWNYYFFASAFHFPSRWICFCRSSTRWSDTCCNSFIDAISPGLNSCRFFPLTSSMVRNLKIVWIKHTSNGRKIYCNLEILMDFTVLTRSTVFFALVLAVHFSSRILVQLYSEWDHCIFCWSSFVL